MNRLFLEVYFAHQLTENAVVHSWLDFFHSTSTFIFIFIIFLLLIFTIVFVIPLLFRNPKNYYKRFIAVREEMQKIDDFYSDKKISFEEYTFAQFNYAKEYEIIVRYLSKFPEYKDRLKTYKIKDDPTHLKITTNTSTKRDHTVVFLFNLLRSHAKYYSSEELYQSILDEGFNRDVANDVITKMKEQGILFASETKAEQSKIINIINSLLSKKYENPPEIGKASSSDLKELTTKRKNVFEEESVTFEKYPSFKKEEEPTPKFSFSDIFKKKSKPHTVSEINDIFAKIEKKLKEEN